MVRSRAETVGPCCYFACMSTGSSSLTPLLVAARGLAVLDHPLRTASDLADDLVGFDQLFCLLEAERVRVVASFDAMGGGGIDGFQSTASWLRARTSIAPGASSELVRVARALDRQLPATAVALRDGAIGWTAAVTVVQGLSKLVDPGVSDGLCKRFGVVMKGRCLDVYADGCERRAAAVR
jgi:hypothetical protein